MSNLYDQMMNRNKAPMTKVASSLSPEKTAGIAEELAMIAANMEKEQLEAESANDVPVEMQEEIPAEVAEAIAAAEGQPTEEAPVEEAEEEAEEETEEEAPVEETEDGEEEIVEGESKDEPTDDEKEATAFEILDGLLKLAAEEIAAEMQAAPAPPPVAPELESSVQLLSILDEAAIKEEQDSQMEAQEKAIQDAINEKALMLAQDILTSDDTQGQIMEEAEKMAYSLVPAILKTANASMLDYAYGLIGDEKLANVILDEAEKIASENGMPVALVIEDIIKVAMSQE